MEPLGETIQDMTTILVVDNHAIIRRGVIHILEKEFTPVSVIEASSGQSAIEAVRQHKCDAVVLDIHLPDKNGIEALKEIKLMCPALPVLMLTLFLDEEYAIQAFKAGASGYLSKERLFEDFALALRKVMGGGNYVHPAFKERLATILVAKTRLVPHQTLSDREQEVLYLIAKGQSLTQISARLSLSVKTIETYLTQIKEKLNLTTTASLIRYAIENHLVD